MWKGKGGREEVRRGMLNVEGETGEGRGKGRGELRGGER